MTYSTPPSWSATEKILFRFFALYFTIQVLPLDPHFYSQLAGLSGPAYRVLFYASRYMPEFISGAGILNWGLIGLIALAGTVVWTRLEPNRDEYNQLYYG
ncbi:MAG: DoxX family protein, partial [Siphonobacter sp.]